MKKKMTMEKRMMKKNQKLEFRVETCEIDEAYLAKLVRENPNKGFIFAAYNDGPEKDAYEVGHIVLIISKERAEYWKEFYARNGYIYLPDKCQKIAKKNGWFFSYSVALTLPEI